MVNWTPDLPDIFPLDDILVEDESHFYETNEGDGGTILEQTEYTLNKAPITSVEEVTGVFDGSSTTFDEGVDYELSSDNERIVWIQNGDSPDPGTLFFVDYRCQSIISRYIEANVEEFDDTEHAIREIIDSKFVDRADGDELDRLGALFGQLGKRRGRDDPEYRIYLKSVVQSLISRGKKSDIREAVAAAIGIDESEVFITENFSTTSYDVKVPPIISHRTSTIQEIAEIADPSGVDLSKIHYLIDDEEVGIADSVETTEGLDVGTDVVGSDDVVVIDPNKFQTSDTAVVDDSLVATFQESGGFQWASAEVSTISASGDSWNSFDWDDGGWGVGTGLTQTTSGDRWDFMEWVELTDLARAISDGAILDDAVAVNANKTTVSDASTSNDSVIVDDNLVTTADSAFADDSTSSSTTTVSWSQGDWNTMKWAVEHN